MHRTRNNKSHLMQILMLFILSSTAVFAQSQIDNYAITGVKSNQIDTLALENAQKVVREATGLFEKEIDPKTYLLGPNDELTIAILGAKSRQLNATISSEGKIFIQDVGIVDLKNKTLAEAEKLIKEKVATSFKAVEIDVLLKDIRKFKVIVGGYVQKPAIVPATAVERVSEVIEKAGGLKYNASLRNILLYRDGGKIIQKVDLLKFYMTGEKEMNPTVLGGDYVLVTPINETESVQILGDVGGPGKFEYSETDSLSTLFRIGQGFLQSAFLDSIEIVRFSENGSSYSKQYFNAGAWKNILQNHSNLEGDFPLKPGDRVFVRRIPYWHKKFDVAIAGEIKYPGHYVIDENSIRISDLIYRAGGFTNVASLEKAVLIRRSEYPNWDREMERLWKLNKTEMSESEFRYLGAKKNEVPGLVSIDFEKIIKDPGSPDNIILVNEDSIYIPKMKYFISVQGMVNKPGLIAFKEGLNYIDYINLAGGFSYNADKGNTMVLKTKGERLLAKSYNYNLEPGDNILVPPESEKIFSESLTSVMTLITQIITVLGVVIAIIKTR